LYIHIGAPKTGTTALQFFLAQNRQALKAKGFLYPGSDPTHLDICTVLPKDIPIGIEGCPRTAVPRYLAEIRRSPCHTYILSAEYLAFTGNAEVLRELIPTSTAVRIVYYARRQDFLIESYYNQQMKSHLHWVKKRLDEVPLSRIYSKLFFDHSRVITPWADLFGKENIIVRCYEKQQMQGDSIRDFAQVIGLSLDDTFSFPKDRFNISMDMHHLEFIRLCNKAFLNNPEVIDFVFNNRLIYHSRIFENLPKRNLLSPEIRNEILDHYEESNRTIARDYLGRADDRLFYEPRPDPGELYEPYPGLSINELAPIVTEMITNMDLQQEQIEPLATLLKPLNRIAKIAAGILPGAIRRAVAEKADALNW
jgi:hypothetical protein